VRRALPALVAATLVVAGCGESSKEDYANNFRPINAELVQLGKKIAVSAASALNKSDREIAKEFGDHAEATVRARRRLDDLDPPDDLKSEQDDLSTALGDAEHALEGIANAAREHSPEDARRSTLDLIEASRKLRTARRKLAAATA
jgi:hypothetical protein